MKNRAEATPALLVVRPTDGDFSHASRRGVRLACCTTTTCCLTLLSGAIGGVAGIGTGIAMVAKSRSQQRPATKQQTTAGGAMLGVLRILLYALGYCIAGLLMGAAVGFGLDILFVFR